MIQRIATLFVFLAFLCADSRAASAPPRLVQVLPGDAVSQREMVCPCEFDLGRQIDGEPGLIIDHNGEGQPAYVNIDGVVLRLENSTPFKFSCQARERIKGSWASPGVKVSVILTSDGPGEESCWFRGELTARKGRRKETRRIIGACGC